MLKLNVNELVALIRDQHRQRMFLIKQRIRCGNALGAYIRTCLGWAADLPEADRERIRKEAEEIVKSAGEGTVFAMIIAADRAAQAKYEEAEKDIEKALEKLAKRLPVWSFWAKSVQGFGALGLATIVGEAGNLSDYPKKGHLWKRLGVGLVDGIRQGGLPSTATADEWIAHGYNRERRARLYGYVGTALINQGPYRDYYLLRKDIERQKAESAGLTVAPSKKIPTTRKAEFMSDLHVHRRAQRKTEKRLLRDLLAAWKKSTA